MREIFATGTPQVYCKNIKELSGKISMYKKVMLVLVLLCLILLSMIAWKVGVFAGIANLFDPMVIDKIGDWFARASSYANFCTLFLFLLFVIGKIWILQRNKNLYKEKLNYLIVDVEEEFDRQFLLGEMETIEISSPDGIYDINVYEIKKWNKNYTKIKNKKLIDKKYEDNIQHPLKLNKDEKVYIRIDLPEGPPVYQVEIIKYDYSKITIALSSNGKVGGLVNNAKTKRGLRSYLYYLCS